VSHRSALLPRSPELPRPADPTAWAPEALLDLVHAVADDPPSWREAIRFDAGRRHWARLPAPEGAELWLLTWLPDQSTDLHDHGPSAAALTVVTGVLEEVRADVDGRRSTSVLTGGDGVQLAPGVVHDVGNRGTAPAVSVHAYSPPLSSMSFYETSPAGLHRVRTVLTDQPEES
jgi:quercetin dioxygenase-like cupin family protein